MRTIVVSLVLVLAATAAADPAKSKDPAQLHADDCAKARAANRACVLDMSGEDVGGTAPGAHGTASTAITFPPNTSLIHLRRDFITQIVKTAQEL
jgi:hypothetical protein